MNRFDRLKENWQSQSGIAPERFDAMVATVNEGSDRFRRSIFRRDMIETAAAVFVVFGFSIIIFESKNWGVCIGSAIVVVSAIIIPIVLWFARRRPGLEFARASFRDFVKDEIDYLQRQLRLVQSVGWWYLLPLYVGSAMVMIGATAPHGTPELVLLSVCLVLCAALYIYLWWVNQRASRRYLEPLLKYYVELRNVLEQGGDEGFDGIGPPPNLAIMPRPSITRRHRSIGLGIAIVATLIVVVAGYYLIQNFDRRTGLFVASTAPVVGVLMVVCTGAWRRVSSVESSSDAEGGATEDDAV